MANEMSIQSATKFRCDCHVIGPCDSKARGERFSHESSHRGMVIQRARGLRNAQLLSVYYSSSPPCKGMAIVIVFDSRFGMSSREDISADRSTHCSKRAE